MIEDRSRSRILGLQGQLLKCNQALRWTRATPHNQHQLLSDDCNELDQHNEHDRRNIGANRDDTKDEQCVISREFKPTAASSRPSRVIVI